MCSIKINRGDVRIPKNWRAFLSNIENKNELVSFLIATWQTYTCKVQEGLTLVLSGVTATIVTHELVQSYAGLISNHDEADTRLILHAADALRSYDLAVIRSVDTDVLVIGIHHFNAMVGDGGKDVVMHMGMGACQRYISLVQLTRNLPAAVQRNILPLHVLTGCDSVSSLFRISKSKAIETMKSFDEDLTALGENATELVPDAVAVQCEKFIASMYGSFTDVTEARYRLLATKCIDKDSQLPPSANALKYHLKRAAYQIHAWKLALQTVIVMPSAVGGGWDESLSPVLCDESPHLKAMMLSCACKKSGCTSGSCKCHRGGLKCSDLCTCQSCQNHEEDDDEDDLSDAETDGKKILYL